MASNVTFGDELLFPSEFIAAFDLNGKDLTLTIAKIEKPELRLASGGTKKKGVITFKDHPKKFVLNVTNAESIKIVTGERAAEKWVGHRITLYQAKTSSPKGIVDCIRVRETKPPAAKDGPASAPAAFVIPDAWIGAIKRADSAERLKSLFDQASAKKWPEESLKEYGTLLDARAAELEAEKTPDEAPAEPTAEPDPAPTREPGEEG